MGEDFEAAGAAGLVVLVVEAGLAAPALPKKLIIEDLGAAFDFEAVVVAWADAGVLATGADVEEGDGDTTDAAGLVVGAVGFAAKALLGFGAAGAEMTPRLADFEMVTSLFWTIL